MQLERSFEIIDRAYAQYKPVAVFSMFSGGNDSLTTLDVARRWGIARGVPVRAAHINTTTGIEETRVFVHSTAELMSVPLHEYCAAESYDDWVLAGGFPGPAQHHIMYNRLKQRSIAQLLRETKRTKRDKILLIAGARQQESTRRMSTTQEMRVDASYGSAVWVNAIWHYSKDDVLDHKEAAKLPDNPVVAMLHMSGECGCGAYASQGEREERKFWFPKWYGRIEALEQSSPAQEWAKKGWKWCWGEAPPAWVPQVRAGQQWLGDEFSPMCQSCELRQSARVSV